MARQWTPSSARSTVGAPVPSSRLEIQPAGEDAGGRGLADAAHAGQHPGMRDAAGREGVAAACAPSAPGRSGRRSAPGGISARAPDSRERFRSWPAGAASSRRKVRVKAGGWTATRAESRWGCFLPDLTRLASGTSAANLPAPISPLARRGASAGSRPARGRCSRRLPGSSARPEADEEAEAEDAEKGEKSSGLRGAPTVFSASPVARRRMRSRRRSRRGRRRNSCRRRRRFDLAIEAASAAGRRPQPAESLRRADGRAIVDATDQVGSAAPRPGPATSSAARSRDRRHTNTRFGLTAPRRTPAGRNRCLSRA